jgi:periplasmic protein TonB
MTASVLGAASAHNVSAGSPKHPQFEKKSFKNLSAFGWALLLEATLIASHPVQPPDKVIPITNETTAPDIEKLPEPEKPKPPEPPKPILPPPVQPPLPQAKVVPPPVAQLPVAKEAPAAVQAPAHVLPAAPVLPATPVVAAPAPMPAPSLAPPPPPPVAASQDVQIAFAGKVKAAAQAALEVPGTVAALRFRGRTRVGFSLKDGVASNITVIQTSGLGAMDRAATKAVQSASFPATPPALQGKEIIYEIWVTVEPTN